MANDKSTDLRISTVLKMAKTHDDCVGRIQTTSTT